jgi:hypothetical protein
VEVFLGRVSNTEDDDERDKMEQDNKASELNKEKAQWIAILAKEGRMATETIPLFCWPDLLFGDDATYELDQSPLAKL